MMLGRGLGRCRWQSIRIDSVLAIVADDIAAMFMRQAFSQATVLIGPHPWPGCLA